MGRAAAFLHNFDHAFDGWLHAAGSENNTKRIENAHLCCGSAGTYNLEQPAIAASLGEKKARAVIAAGAEFVVSGNIGCLTQLRSHLARLGAPIPLRHTMQLLRDAYGGGLAG